MGGPRSNFPHSLYFVAATQADTPRANYLAFVRLTNLQQVCNSATSAAQETIASRAEI